MLEGGVRRGDVFETAGGVGSVGGWGGGVGAQGEETQVFGCLVEEGEGPDFEVSLSVASVEGVEEVFPCLVGFGPVWGWRGGGGLGVGCGGFFGGEELGNGFVVGDEDVRPGFTFVVGGKKWFQRGSKLGLDGEVVQCAGDGI